MEGGRERNTERNFKGASNSVAEIAVRCCGKRAFEGERHWQQKREPSIRESCGSVGCEDVLV
jgi:hypothetical protein